VKSGDADISIVSARPGKVWYHIQGSIPGLFAVFGYFPVPLAAVFPGYMK
jgi:hypothetical protein